MIGTIAWPSSVSRQPVCLPCASYTGTASLIPAPAARRPPAACPSRCPGSWSPRNAGLGRYPPRPAIAPTAATRYPGSQALHFRVQEGWNAGRVTHHSLLATVPFNVIHRVDAHGAVRALEVQRVGSG